MFLVVGLGNPGAEYVKTRHNVGFTTADAIADEYNFSPFRNKFDGLIAEGRIGKEKVYLLKPQTYMNLSGNIAPECVGGDDTVVVVVDQMDLPPGKIRIRRGGSSAGHNGLKSMIGAIGPDFIRVYIGTGRPAPGVKVVDHVLAKYSAEDRVLVSEAEDRAAEAILSLYGGESFERVAQRANS